MNGDWVFWGSKVLSPRPKVGGEGVLRSVGPEGRVGEFAGVHNMLSGPALKLRAPDFQAGQRSRGSPETVGTGGIGGQGRFRFCRPVVILAVRQSVDCLDGLLTKAVLLSTMFSENFFKESSKRLKHLPILGTDPFPTPFRRSSG